MSRKFLISSVLLLNLFACTVPLSCLSLPNSRLLNLRALYLEHQRDWADTNTTGNFFKATDGTVLFFQSEKRELFRQILAGQTSQKLQRFLVLQEPYKHIKTQILSVSKSSDCLSVGSYTIEESELDRLRLTSGWPEVLDFCQKFIVDDTGKYLPLRFSSITRLNKNEFLICGGHDYVGYKISKTFQQPSRLAQVFDVSCKRVIKTFPLVEIHSGNRSILLPNGNVLITGSDSPGSADPTLIEIADPRSCRSVLLKSKLCAEKSGSTLSLDSDGRCLIFPGQSTIDRTDLVECLDPITDRIKAVGSMKTPRWYSDWVTEIPHNSTMLARNLALVSGGSACSDHADEMFQRRDAELVSLDLP
ncbi:MAG: hypothetical protein IPM93_28925 [Candidatus Obscuribacter sp.]|jgi:hypothetical protein|nr:hypothetical protein [Candidatus Obscuribacter sp.]